MLISLELLRDSTDFKAQQTGRVQKYMTARHRVQWQTTQNKQMVCPQNGGALSGDVIEGKVPLTRVAEIENI